MWLDEITKTIFVNFNLTGSYPNAQLVGNVGIGHTINSTIKIPFNALVGTTAETAVMQPCILELQTNGNLVMFAPVNESIHRPNINGAMYIGDKIS